MRAADADALREPPSTAENLTSPVVLALAGSAVERSAIDAWVRSHCPPGVEVVAPVELTRRLARDDDPLILPVRVAWLPREQDGERRARWSDVLALANPRRPRPAMQARIVAREPDRCHVVAGEPARESGLRERWVAEGGAGPESGAFAEYVERQGALALERAERAVIGDRYKVPRLVVEQILDSARFRSEVTALAERLHMPEQEVAGRAAGALSEMVAVQSRLAIDLFSGFMRPLHGRAWTVDVDEPSLDALRELNRRHPLVFLPTHRSYADPLVLAQVLHEHDFPRNHMLGGDNMAFWPLGLLGRRAGVVFIRRSFRDDEVYKLALREYLGFLVSKRFNLEWYIEGGRTRTGKLRAPRYGLLRYLVDAVDAGLTEDVYLIPVSMTYDQLREVSAMAAEERGAAKAREGLRWMADYVRAQRINVGTVRVRFGEPLSLREGLAATREGPDAGDTRLAMQKVAFEVSARINRVTPVTATSLVTLALLGVRDRALTLDEVQRLVVPLLDYIEARGLPTGGLERLREAPAVRGVLDALAHEGVVTAYAGGPEPVYAVEPGQHNVAAFYRNGAAHWFLNRAIVELALVHVASDSGPETATKALAYARAVRDVLKFEFFFADKPTFTAELAAEVGLLDPAWRDLPDGPAGPTRMLADADFLVAHRVLSAFLDSYMIVADRLAASAPELALDEKAFLDECARVGRQYLLQRRVHSPESVSREIFATALKLARNRRLVEPAADAPEELARRRRAFADEIAGVVQHLAAVEALDVTIRGGRRDVAA